MVGVVQCTVQTVSGNACIVRLTVSTSLPSSPIVFQSSKFVLMFDATARQKHILNIHLSLEVSVMHAACSRSNLPMLLGQASASG